jgi:hypothetical protein
MWPKHLECSSCTSKGSRPPPRGELASKTLTLLMAGKLVLSLEGLHQSCSGRDSKSS